MNTIFIDLFVLYFISGDLDASVNSFRIKKGLYKRLIVPKVSDLSAKREFRARAVCVVRIIWSRRRTHFGNSC